jgi:glycosyltransferase involved in cell wall biosynthesis
VLTVAIDATPLLGEPTGIGAFAAGLIPALAARDDLDLVGYGLSWAGRAQLPTLLPRRVRKARAPMVASPLLRLWQHTAHPTAEWWTGPVDVIHGTNFVVPPTRRAAQVVSVHDLTSVRFPELCTPTALRYPALVRRAIDQGAIIHTDSWAMAEEVVELLGAPKDRVRTVYLGIDWDRLAVGSEPPLRPHDRPYVLGLGTVEPRKDFPGLVRAFDAVAADHPDVDLVIAGPRGWGEGALEAAIDQADHRARVHRLGWVDPDRRTALLRHASVFAYPSISEGCGLPPLEAMAVGVPVVATAVGAVAEVTGDAARLVRVGDGAQLAATLSAVLDDEAERSRLIAAGRARAAAFTWEKCARGLHDVYLDAAAGARI